MTTVQTPVQAAPPVLGVLPDLQRERLVALRAGLLSEQAAAVSPAVGRALEMADAYLFLALGYLGHTDELFPGESGAEASPP